MKIVNAYKTKERIAKKFVSMHKNPPTTWDKNAEFAMDMVDEEPEVLLSCPYCNGTGKTYELIVTNQSNTEIIFEKKDCNLCQGTGKITIDRYETYQKKLRDLKLKNERK